MHWALSHWSPKHACIGPYHTGVQSTHALGLITLESKARIHRALSYWSPKHAYTGLSHSGCAKGNQAADRQACLNALFALQDKQESKARMNRALSFWTRKGQVACWQWWRALTQWRRGMRNVASVIGSKIYHRELNVRGC
eukprot:1158994-Pelagomonas_calceolata.AAC.9